ncbi:2771_t:CDS:2, partial [Racocetra persica]
SQPRAFMIDADPGLKSVVFEIYPDTYLLHCVWHIGFNIEKQLAKLLGDRYADFIKAFYQEQFTGQFAAWHKKTASYMTPSVPGQLFPNIYNILQKYMMPKILQLHTDQMNETVMYCSKRVSFENLYNLTLEVVDNGPIEFEYDFCQIWFDELLEGVDYFLVAEVWNVQSIEHNSHVGQNNTMLIEPPVQTAAKVIGRKQSIKGILLGLARKCVEEAQCNKQTIEQELNDDQIAKNNQDTESDQNTENDQDIRTIQLDVQDSFKYIGKGCPSKKRIKSAIEKPKKRICTLFCAS